MTLCVSTGGACKAPLSIRTRRRGTGRRPQRPSVGPALPRCRRNCEPTIRDAAIRRTDRAKRRGQRSRVGCRSGQIGRQTLRVRYGVTAQIQNNIVTCHFPDRRLTCRQSCPVGKELTRSFCTSTSMPRRALRSASEGTAYDPSASGTECCSSVLRKPVEGTKGPPAALF